MTRCPKCGSNRIHGPRYRRTNSPIGEELEYRCERCGYTETHPTLDAEPRT